MPKQLTVFYSWQSDTPSKLNRNFIEEALHEALKRLHSDATLEVALRDATVELDKDTKGIAGSPPIADTILRKIEDCTAFVADLTFVGESKQGLAKPFKEPRLFPNPNVLIEHGFALRCRGHTALVGVMNTAYGKPDGENLPFDLRHLRRPITYHLADSSDAEKTEQFERLTATLVEALRLILANSSSPKTPITEFIPHKATKNAAVFWDEHSDLLVERTFGGKPESFTVPYEAKAYLRLYPTEPVPMIDMDLDARDLARTGDLRPLGPVDGNNRMSGYSTDRNPWGALVYEAPKDGMLYHFTQLFLNREIWGVDASSVNAAEIRKFIEMTLGPPLKDTYIASKLLESNFVVALQSYVKFAQHTLKLPIPLRVEAGLVGIKGYAIAIGRGIDGKAIHDQVSWLGEILSYETPAHDVLAPFFDRVWAECGFRRPPSRQAELVQQFGGKK